MRRIGHAPPDANTIAARVRDWEIAAGLEALFGTAPTDAEQAVLNDSIGMLLLADFDELPRGHTSALAHPESRAAGFHTIGHQALTAALTPRRTLKLRGVCAVFPAVESLPDALVRKGATLLGGPAAEGYSGAGSFFSHPEELAAVAYAAHVLACRHGADPAGRFGLIRDLTASVLGGTWGLVETAEAARGAGEPVDGILAQLAEEHRRGGDLKHGEAISRYIHEKTEYVRKIALKLGSARQ